MGNKSSSEAEARKLWVHCEEQPEIAQLHKRFPDNRIVTARYSIWNFVPKNLFEQFRRIANFYFLCMVIIQLLIDSPVSVTTSALPLVFVVAVTMAKQGYEDWLRHRGDQAVNNALVTVVRRGCVQEVRACELHVGEVVRVSEEQPVPCDILLLSSSDPTGLCHVTTANLDGETNLKTLRCPRTLRHLRNVEELYRFRAQIECDPPSSDLYTFHGRIEVLPAGPGPGSLHLGHEGPGTTEGEDRASEPAREEEQLASEALDTENLLLRGATLKNTEFVYGCAVYTGQESKLALNSRLTSNKFSTVEKSVNKFLIFFMVFLFCEVALCTGLKFGIESTHVFGNFFYLGPLPGVSAQQVSQDVFSFVVLFNYIIPISLYVTMELQKFLGSLFFEWDIEMYCPELNERAICNSSDLNEELGQVEYLFTDKTGTLTENDMVFRRCSVSGVCYEERRGHLLQLGPDGDPRRSIRTLSTLPAEVETFLLCVAVCHSVQVAPPRETESKELEYQANSPDEKALVEAAQRCGVQYMGEISDIITLTCRGRELKYKRLESIEFSSDRKCMSVVVEDPEGQVWLVCKGAESSVLQMCTSGPIQETLKHVSDFAMRGLRTLVIARRALTAEKWKVLRDSLQRARQMVGADRATAVSAASASLETELVLLGASGVEDRLQPGVQETLESLRAAGIKVWVLTGDKVETAVNVSFSCGHLKPGTVQLNLTEQTTSADCLAVLHQIQSRIVAEPLAQFGLVMDGLSLALALKFGPELLREVSSACSTVLACRLSPLQKCEVVQLIKTAPGRPITAAVGDGANDVSMIQEAHVGIGIMGKEGRQAVRCSDFAVPRFQHLRRALLVHGHWYYQRVSILVQYFFYKNAAFITPQVFFAFNSLYSTQSLYDSFSLTCFNVFFTSLPVLLYGLMEQDLPAATLLAHPHNYKRHRRNKLLAWPRFIGWTVLGLWHATVMYYGPWLLISANSTSLLWDNTDAGLWVMGNVVFHGAVIVVNLKLWIISRYWTFFFVGSILLSMFGFIGITAGYSAIYIPGTTADFYMTYIALLGSPAFWLLSLVLCTACLLPDAAMLAWKQLVPPGRLSWRKLKKGLARRGRETRRVTKIIFNKSTGRLTISGSMHDRGS